MNKPEFKVLPVTKVIYNLHNKMDRPDSIKVTYYSGLAKRTTEWVCLEHGGIAGDKARLWWLARTDSGDVPETTKEALTMLSDLKSPTHIRVWVNKKYPEVMACSFTGGFDDN
jgi:DNA repair protein RadD